MPYLVRLVIVVAVVLTVAALELAPIYAEWRGGPDVDPPAGFTGDVSQPPTEGAWRATGTYTDVRGYLGRDVGERIVRRWWTERRCAAAGCSYVLTREMARHAPQSARLVLRDDGWHATFPKLVLNCSPTAQWEQETEFVLRFTSGGRALAGHEVHHSFAPECGYGVSRVDWTAHRAADPAGAVAGDGPVAPHTGPVNAITELAMALSVARVVTQRIAGIERQVGEALGRDVALAVDDTSCRSRENTRSRTGSAFTCFVEATQMRAPGGHFTIGVLVSGIEGRCWRGVHYGFAPRPHTRPTRYDEDVIERNLAYDPLRGCA